MDKYFLDKIENNREILRNFLKPKNKKYKTGEKVKEFLLEELFNINGNIYYLVKDKRLDAFYSGSKILKSNRVILNIPIEDITISLTIEQAKRINIIGPYYQDLFNENKINFKYYDEENYSEAIRLFLEAAAYNPYELVYLENAANAYMKIQEDQKALELLDKLVLEFDAKSPKIFYLRGLLLYGFERKEEACRDFKIAYDGGLIDTSFYLNFCN